MGQASAVQRLDSAIDRINLYPVDSAIIISLPNTYPWIGLSTFEQPGPGV